MKAIRVQYTVNPDFVETNKKNIERVMLDVRKLNSPSIKYSSFLMDDGVTFMHFVMYADEEASKILSTLESFAKFLSELKASNPSVPPKADTFSLVASAYDIF